MPFLSEGVVAVPRSRTILGPFLLRDYIDEIRLRISYEVTEISPGKHCCVIMSNITLMISALFNLLFSVYWSPVDLGMLPFSCAF